jgi:hypothetical protein
MTAKGHIVRILCLALASFLSAAFSPAFADPAPAELGVLVQKAAGDGVHFMHGSGVYLGDGLVLTAGHAVHINPSDPTVVIRLDGRLFTGTVVRDGQAENVDLALVKIPAESLPAQRRTQPQVAVCKSNPPPKQPVTVVSQETVTAATTVPSAVTSDLQNTGTWTDLLSTGYHEGSSGGGVFDKDQGCLWGIIRIELSGRTKDTGRDLDLTAFVPATKIASFLAEYEHSPQ